MKQNRLGVYIFTGAICFAALCTCMANNIVGPLLSDIMGHYQISLDGGGTMSLFQNIGGTLSIVLLCVVMDKLNKPLVLIVPLLILPACLLLIGAVPSYTVFILLYMLIGICLCTIDMISNAVISDIHQQKRDAALSLLHSFAPLGALVVPVFAGYILDQGIPWQRVYYVIGLLCALLMLIYAAAYLSVRKTLFTGVKKAEVAHESGMLRRILGDYRVLVAAGCVMLFGAFQSGLAVWGTKFCKDVFGSNAMAAGLSVTIYWVATGITRLLFSFTRLKLLPTRPVILYGSLGAAFTLVAGLISGSYTVLLISIFLTGCLNAQVIPRAIGLVTGWYKQHSALASSAVLVALYISFGASPLLMGAVAQRMGIRTILYLPAAFTALAGLLAIVLPKDAGETER